MGAGFFLFDHVITSNVSKMLANNLSQSNQTGPTQPLYKSWRQGPALQAGKVLPGQTGELPGGPARSAPLPRRPRPFPA